MKKLLLLGVETLDVEPMIEENLESPFHFYQLFKKDHHLSEMGAYYIAQSIYNHLNGYDYFKTLIKNDYSVELKFEKERILYHGEQFKDMDTISIRKNIAPTNNLLFCL